MNNSDETKPNLSLCMIARDEEHCIERVLQSARAHVKEIIVVDTGSVDRTVEIAKKYADKTEFFSWIDDFSAARNYALKFATQPWILVLDADELMSPSGFMKSAELIKTDAYDGFYMTQRLYHDEEVRSENWRLVKSRDTFSGDYLGYVENRIVRLFRNDPAIRYSCKVHEIVDYSISSDRIGDSGVPIHHYHENEVNNSRQHVLRNLAIQERLISTNEATSRDYLSAGMAHMRVTRDLEKAKRYLITAFEFGADALPSLEAVAEAFYRSGATDQAVQVYRRLFDIGHRSTATLNNLSNLLVKQGDFSGAISALTESLNQGIKNPESKARVEQNLAALQRALDESQNQPH